MTAFLYRRILVGFDGSPAAAHALTVACQVAGSDGEVVALAVTDADGHLETTGEEQREASAQERRLTTQFEAAALQTVGARSRLEFAVGRHIAESLAEHAERRGFDLVVVGRHGTEGLTTVGHIVQALIRQERLAVLLAPQP